MLWSTTGCRWMIPFRGELGSLLPVYASELTVGTGCTSAMGRYSHLKQPNSILVWLVRSLSFITGKNGADHEQTYLGFGESPPAGVDRYVQLSSPRGAEASPVTPAEGAAWEYVFFHFPRPFCSPGDWFIQDLLPNVDVNTLVQYPSVHLN
jgi:hypothetical protein